MNYGRRASQYGIDQSTKKGNSRIPIRGLGFQKLDIVCRNPSMRRSGHAHIDEGQVQKMQQVSFGKL
jgi:hypothetical protein